MPDDANNGSRLAENVLLFCRTLRAAGLPIGPGRVIDALRAVTEAGIGRRDDFYWALRAVLATDPSQFRIFDQAFHLYFRNPRLLERMMSLMLPTLVQERESPAGERAARRLLEALAGDDEQSRDEPLIDVDRAGSWSSREVLRRKDFEQMTVEELAQARQLMRDEALAFPGIPTRRFRPHPYGHRYDLRRSMRLMLKNNGQLVELATKRRRCRPPTLVLICDISGSMSRYSRAFLQFAHVLSSRRQSVHAFVFGTRLTNITRRLGERDIDKALAMISGDVVDWDGGTRIADCLGRFNADWGRRVLARGATVVLLTDGLERDSTADLDFQMQRLHRSCNRLIWMNPMLRYDGFEPKAGGVRTMLPHVDDFIPAHNIDSLAGLSSLLRERAA